MSDANQSATRASESATETERMLPCPSCGETDVDATFAQSASGDLNAGCMNCGMTGPQSHTPRDAVDRWNALPRSHGALRNQVVEECLRVLSSLEGEHHLLLMQAVSGLKEAAPANVAHTEHPAGNRTNAGDGAAAPDQPREVGRTPTQETGATERSVTERDRAEGSGGREIGHEDAGGLDAAPRSSIAFTKEDAAKIVERKARALTEEYCHGDGGPDGYTWTNKEAEWQVILLEELAEEFRNVA